MSGKSQIIIDDTVPPGPGYWFAHPDDLAFKVLPLTSSIPMVKEPLKPPTKPTVGKMIDMCTNDSHIPWLMSQGYTEERARQIIQCNNEGHAAVQFQREIGEGQEYGSDRTISYHYQVPTCSRCGRRVGPSELTGTSRH